ncbi:MAG: hypothetical protein LBG59_07570 [Candidatus Peribacteria bacterium]|jgi:hypothetical protein|nr:hypothetical protein [Candidatus Peribacteria bacterium]
MPYTDEQLKKLYDTYSTASQDKQQKVLDTLLSNSGENYGQIQSYFASQINAAKNSATTPTTPTSAVDRANPVPTSGTPIQQPTS